jgi:hypothetical protein
LDSKPHILEQHKRIALRTLLTLVLVAACGCRAAGPGKLSARVILLQPDDTVLFSTDAVGHSCAGGRGVLLEGSVGGNGVLLWLRSGDSPAGGDYKFLARGDSLTPRGVMGAIRFIVSNSDRGVTLDSGLVTVSAGPGRKDVRVRGSGIDPSVGRRAVLDASFDAVSLMADTVTCRIQLES